MGAHSPRVRVLFYEPYPMGLGGNFLTQSLLLARLDRARFEPLILAPVEGAALDAFRRSGVECVVMPPDAVLNRYGGRALRAGLLGRAAAAWGLVGYNLAVARLLRARRIDVVYANCVRAQLFAGLGAWLARVPILLYVKGELANPLIDRLCLLSASKVLFFSASNRDDCYSWLIRWIRPKIEILPIGMDFSHTKAAGRRDPQEIRREAGVDPATFNVVVVAQLYPPKGQHFALQALAEVVKVHPATRLYFLGDHVLEEYRGYRAELESLAAQLGLADRVHFLGWRANALEIVRIMDLVVHPSLAEGFGRAVLEAMALGKPVVASRVGGLREAIRQGENGFLFAPGDVPALVRHWLALQGNPPLAGRLAAAAQATAWRDYQIEDKADRLAEIWATMAGKTDHVRNHGGV
jgi:glycosyltransferase involved in cell wall biosynthesis